MINETVVKNFEQGWFTNNSNPIQHYVNDLTEDDYLETLEELVCIEIELAWKHWDSIGKPLNSRPKTVTSYISAFSELHTSETVLHLLREELVSRRRCGDTINKEAFLENNTVLEVHETDLEKLFDMEVLPNLSDKDTAITSLQSRRSTRKDLLITDNETTAIKRLGQYVLIERIGHGGMGIVYKAYDETLKRFVAIKMLRGVLQLSNYATARLMVEAKSIAQLNHPNIVQMHDIGQDEGGPFLVMQFASGGNLIQKLSGGVLSPKAAAELLNKLCLAVGHSHERGIVHRDIKPGNVLFDENGEPILSDFGLAKSHEIEDAITKSGEMLGTPAYMSPEQIRDASSADDPTTDIYSLGAMLYECLVGRPPFQGATAAETVNEVLEAMPIPPRNIRKMIPVDLDTICLKCLDKNPASRYLNANALSQDLTAFLNGHSIVARPISKLRKSFRWIKRYPYRAISLTTLFSIFIGIVLLQNYLREAANLEREQQIKNVSKQSVLRVDAEKARDDAELARDDAEISRDVARQADYLTTLQLVNADIRDFNYLIARQRIANFQKQNSKFSFDPTGTEWDTVKAITNDSYFEFQLPDNLRAAKFAYSDSEELLACFSLEFESRRARLHVFNLLRDRTTHGVVFDVEQIVDNQSDGPEIVWSHSRTFLVGSRRGLFSIAIPDPLSPQTKLIVDRLSAEPVYAIRADYDNGHFYVLSDSEDNTVHELQQWQSSNSEGHRLNKVLITDSYSSATMQLAINTEDHMAAISAASTLFIYDLTTGKRISSVDAAFTTQRDLSKTTIKSVVFIPPIALGDNRNFSYIAFSGHNKRVELYSLNHDSGAMKPEFQYKSHLGMVQSLDYDRKSGWLLSAGNDGVIACFTPHSREKRFSLVEHHSEILQASFHHNGAYVISSSFDGKLIVRKRLFSHRTVLHSAHSHLRLHGAPSIVSDGETGLFIYGNDVTSDFTLHHIDLATGEAVNGPQHLSAVPGKASSSPNGKEFMIPLSDGTVHIVRLEKERLKLSSVTALADSVTGTVTNARVSIYSDYTSNFFVSLLTSNNDEVIAALSPGTNVLSPMSTTPSLSPIAPLMAVDKFGHHMVSVSPIRAGRDYDLQVRLYEIEAGRLTQLASGIIKQSKLPRDVAIVTSVTKREEDSEAILPRIFVSTESPTVFEYEIPVGGAGEIHPNRKYLGHYMDIKDLVVSDDQRRLTSFGGDGNICTWDLETAVDEEGGLATAVLLSRWHVKLKTYGGMTANRNTGALLFAYDNGFSTIPWDTNASRH
jgi:serine/threonine protein kinase/WD40 repeat protein